MEIRITKKNPWENNRNQDGEVQSKAFPKKNLFFDFPNPSKNTKKIVQFKFKNFF